MNDDTRLRDGSGPRESPQESVAVAGQILSGQSFLEAGQYHNELEEEQLAYAGRAAKVKDVSFFHAGDEIYTLEGIPGVWHEECLTAV